MHPSSRSPSLQVTFDWLEVNSGWATPDQDTLADWAADQVCRAPDDCFIEIDALCPHGLVSWPALLLRSEAEEAAQIPANKSSSSGELPGT